jgi:L-asparagine oxygenase
MEPCRVLTDIERDEMHDVLNAVGQNPYRDYVSFARAIADLSASGRVPAFFVDACARIRRDREDGSTEAHVLRNCPLDAHIPFLDHDDPLNDKYAKKRTFVGEALLALFARLVATPLLAYGTRSNGDFFTDVIAHNKYSGQLTGFSDGELTFHNDRTAHGVRADFITLLGMRCPAGDLTYTSFIDGRDLLTLLSDDDQEVLRGPHFVTAFDVFSRDRNSSLTTSEVHPILENHHSFRYLDTHTTVAPNVVPRAKDALLALKNAIARATKTRHRILPGDLFTFVNQDGLHNRELIEINDRRRARSRWLLKTYAFRDQAAANRHADKWLDGVHGRVGD